MGLYTNIWIAPCLFCGKEDPENHGRGGRRERETYPAIRFHPLGSAGEL